MRYFIVQDKTGYIQRLFTAESLNWRALEREYERACWSTLQLSEVDKWHYRSIKRALQSLPPNDADLLYDVRQVTHPIDLQTALPDSVNE